MLVAVYVYSRSRARRYAVRFPALDTLALIAEREPLWRRHLPLLLMLASLAALVLAIARPHTTVRVASGRASLVLVTDHSGSMQATDVAPTRLAAAESAARTFVGELPADTRVGVVTFSSTPDTVQIPTSDRRKVLHIIESQVAIGATDTGGALQAALDALQPEGTSAQSPSKDRIPSAIVLLSDGAANTGRDPVEVATEAGRQKIPIYTVALGSQDATIPNPEGSGAPVPVPPDPELLARIAEASHGSSFTASDPRRLTSIYQRLGAQLTTVPRPHEITAAFAIAGLLLLLGAAGLSLRRGGVLP